MPNEPRTDILVAEDDPDDLLLLLKALQQVRPLNIRVARDGVELCEMIDEPQATGLPRLILLDLNLPRRDGREVLARLRQNGTPVPVLVLTTSSEQDDRDRCLALGAVEVLRKPDEFRALVALMQDTVARYVADREDART